MNFTKKQLSTILIVTIISTLLLATPIIYVLAQSSGTFTIESGVYPGAPSYTIYELGGTYYAKDQNGYNEFSGADGIAVLQSTITASPNGGTFLIIGEISGSTTITISPTQAGTYVFKGLGSWFSGYSPSELILNSPSSVKPLLYIPSTAPTSIYLIIEDLTLTVTHPATGAYAAAAIDIRRQMESVAITNVHIQTNYGLSETHVPASGSIGVKFIAPASGGEICTFRNVDVRGFEIGWDMAADWLKWYDCTVMYSNIASWKLNDGLSSYRNALINCHSYRCGQYAIWDAINSRGVEFGVYVENFLMEAEPPEGWTAREAIVYNPVGNYHKYLYVRSNAAVLAMDYEGESSIGLGVDMGLITADAGTDTRPTATVTGISRATAVSSTLDTSHLYENHACSRLKLSIIATLNPTGDAQALIQILQIPNHGASYGLVYGGAVASVPISGQTGQRMVITTTILPGTQFFIYAANALINGTMIEWLD